MINHVLFLLISVNAPKSANLSVSAVVVRPETYVVGAVSVTGAPGARIVVESGMVTFIF